MNFLNKFFIRSSCTKVGEDEFRNEYFQNKKNKRFVVYKGIVEPSKIPAQWHGWMHYNTDLLPANNTHKFSWQKVHLPNLTGTKSAYSPNDTLVKKTNSEYEAWKPK